MGATCPCEFAVPQAPQAGLNNRTGGSQTLCPAKRKQAVPAPRTPPQNFCFAIECGPAGPHSIARKERLGGVADGPPRFCFADASPFRRASDCRGDAVRRPLSGESPTRPYGQIRSRHGPGGVPWRRLARKPVLSEVEGIPGLPTCCTVVCDRPARGLLFVGGGFAAADSSLRSE